jgi:hypothetical protein
MVPCLTETRSLAMSHVLSEMYQNNQIDPENVSVHSAFICLLHLANEKGLRLD